MNLTGRLEGCVRKTGIKDYTYFFLMKLKVMLGSENDIPRTGTSICQEVLDPTSESRML
jgi:hypothetical protein